jgi:hypothetical protein
MRYKILNKCLLLSVIIITLITLLPNSIGVEITYFKEKPMNNGDIEFDVWGFMAFYIKVTNNRDDPIVAYVNFSMQFLNLGANSYINPFPVKAHSSAVIFWDCQPMPIYFTTVTISAGGENFTKNGFTLLGFNIFFQ